MATLAAAACQVVGPDAGADGLQRVRRRPPGRAARDPGRHHRAAVAAAPGPLTGRHALVTSGPTHEPIDPVRYLANRSSGRAGPRHRRRARRPRRAGHPGQRPGQPAGPRRRHRVHVETAQQMLAACQAALPADVAVCAAAVADWRVAGAAGRRSRRPRRAARRRWTWCRIRTSWRPSPPPAPTARAWSSASPRRPKTSPKTPPPSAPARAATGSSPTTCPRPPASWAERRTPCRWSPQTGSEDWPRLPKAEVAHRLAARIAAALA